MSVPLSNSSRMRAGFGHACSAIACRGALALAVDHPRDTAVSPAESAAPPHGIIVVGNRSNAHRCSRKVVLPLPGGPTSSTGGRRNLPTDRKSVVEGKSVSVRVDLGGRRIIKKKTEKNKVDVSARK